MTSRWWQMAWWRKPSQPEAEESPQTAQTLPVGVERRQSERLPTTLNTYCRLISLLGNDAWPAQVRDLSAGGVGLEIIQPFHVGTYLGLVLQDGATVVGNRLVVKVVHATRSKRGSRWLLGCQILLQLPIPDSQDGSGRPHDIIAWQPKP